MIDEEGVTHYNGAPTVQLMIINHPRARRLEQPVAAMVAASPPSPTLLALMAELNFRSHRPEPALPLNCVGPS